MVSVQVNINSVKFDNPLTNKLTGIVNVSIELRPMNFIKGDRIFAFASLRDPNNNQLEQASPDFLIDQFTEIINHTYQFQFDILQGSNFPDFVTLDIRVATFSNIGVTIGSASTTIAFTGTQPTTEIKVLGMVQTSFDFTKGFKLFEGVLAGIIKVSKTALWNDQFNNTQLILQMQTKDSNDVVLDLQFFPFTFGANSTFEQNIIVVNIKESSVLVELSVVDNANRPFLELNSHTFIEEGTPPIECPIGFHLENGICVPDIPDQCEAGFHLVNGVCLNEGVPVGQGQNTIFGVKCLSNGLKNAYVLSDLEYSNYLNCYR